MEEGFASKGSSDTDIERRGKDGECEQGETIADGVIGRTVPHVLAAKALTR